MTDPEDTNTNTITIRGDASFFGDELPLRVALRHEDSGAVREYEPISTELKEQIDEEWQSLAADPGGERLHE